MALIEKVPLQKFIQETYKHNPAIQKIVEAWAIEATDVTNIIVRHFTDMGIFFVTPSQEELMVENLIIYIRNSPEIKQILQKAKQLEKRKTSSRHSE